MENNKKDECLHEDDIFYGDLIQVDGTPFYCVQCITCKEYGTIELAESTNTFGMSKAEMEDFKSGQAI